MQHNTNTIQHNTNTIQTLNSSVGIPDLTTGVENAITEHFPILKDIETKESMEKIKNAFSFYQDEVLPLILDNPHVIQSKEGYHGLYTHTQNVVFRGICCAVSLGEDPLPVVLACACHDLAKAKNNNKFDVQHGPNAVPVTTEIINNKKFNLSEKQKEQIIEAVRDHSIGEGGKAPNYISACLRDADRVRLSWDRKYNEKFFNTQLGKQIASKSREDFSKFQNSCLNIEGKDPKTITPQDLILLLINDENLNEINKSLSRFGRPSILSLEMIPLYYKITSLSKIKALPEEGMHFLKDLFVTIAQYCDVNACMEIIPNLINDGYDLEVIKGLSIREDNKDIIKNLLDDDEIKQHLQSEVLNETKDLNIIEGDEWGFTQPVTREDIEKDRKGKFNNKIFDISKIITVDNFKYLKDCLKLNVDVHLLPYFREDTSEIIQQYLSGNERENWIGRTLDRIYRRGHTLESIRRIFGEEKITPLTERLLEFKDFDKFKGIGIDEYQNLSTEDKKIFLNGFISALTPGNTLFPSQRFDDENFENIQKMMKIFREFDWLDELPMYRYDSKNSKETQKRNQEICDRYNIICRKLGKPAEFMDNTDYNNTCLGNDEIYNKNQKIYQINNETRSIRLENYHKILRSLLNGISKNERTACNTTSNGISYRKEYRQENMIPPLVDDINKVLDIHTETIKGKKVKIAKLDYNTDLGVSTHRFSSINSLEALEITDPNFFLAIGTNGGERDLNVTPNGYALLVKPRKIGTCYVQAEGDIDSGTGTMKNIFNFEHIMLPNMGDHEECITLIPNAIKKELNLSQEAYAKRINALGNVTTLQEVGEKDKTLELAIRKVLKNVRMFECLMTPTVMGISIGKKHLEDVDEDILDYCVRHDIPLVQIENFPNKEKKNGGNTKSICVTI